MTDNSHGRLYEIVQKVFNAGGKFQLDTELAMHNDKKLPSAYPVITPLINELVEYVDEQIANAKQPTLGIRPVEIHDGKVKQ